MLTFDATALTALASGARGAVFLFEAEFTTGTIYLTNWDKDIDADTGSGSHTYSGKGRVIDVSNLVNSEDPTNEKLRLSVPLVNQAALAAAIGDASTYRNKPIRLYVQIINSDLQPAGAPVMYYDGVMDKHGVERDNNNKHGGAQTGRIWLQCAKRGLSFVRRNTGMRMTDAQHQAAYPGDTWLEYVTSLIEKPAMWASKRFQQV